MGNCTVASRLMALASTLRMSSVRPSWCSALMRTTITESMDSRKSEMSGTSIQPMA